MITFAAFVKFLEEQTISEWESSNTRNNGSLSSGGDSYKGIKGWMSPSGSEHMVPIGTEHYNDHHPEFKKLMAGKNHPTNATGRLSVGLAQRHGFVRFGQFPDSMHGSQAFVHYDARHPKGAETAMKALHYIKPQHNDPVSISGRSGLFRPHVGYNQKAVDDLETTVPARDAYRHLHQQKEKARAKSERQSKLTEAVVKDKTHSALLWYEHPKKGFQVKTAKPFETHAHIFSKEKVAKHYDSINRGRIHLNHDNKTVELIQHPPHLPTKDVFDHLKKHYPQTKTYRWYGITMGQGGRALTPFNE